MNEFDPTDPKKEMPITLRGFAARRFAALVVILAVLCLCVAVAAQPKSDAKTLLQKASEPGAASSSNDQTPATLPYASGDNIEGGSSAPGNALSTPTTGNSNNNTTIAPAPGANTGSSSVVCAPCGQYRGTQPQAIMCPMYYCIAPGPVSPIGSVPAQPPTTSPSPTPNPMPTPTPGEPTCGCGNVTYQPHHVCPMYCMMQAD